jgi:large subunit ribosomal protein L17
MRHQKKTVKLGRTAEHRKALLANQVCSLIEHSRIKTTLAKAKAVRPFAEKMLTLGKRGTLHDRRNAISYLHQPGLVKKLFEEIAPRSAHRAGGYTRIIKLGPRLSDSAPMAYIEWVDSAPSVDELAPKEAKPSAKREAKADAQAEPATATEATLAEPGTAESAKAGAKKKRVVGSRRVADKAKRAQSKTRKQIAASQIRPKVSGARLKNNRGR